MRATATDQTIDACPDTLAQRAYYAIREQLLRGQLRLGSSISSRRMAETLGMSHLPVSQAMRRLEGEGFLESRPRAGTRVRIPTEQNVRQRYEVREALESQVARLFAVRATASQRRELRKMADQLDALFSRSAASDTDDAFRFAVHGYHFDLHMKIAVYADCEALRELIERNQILVFNWMYDVAADRRALPPAFHGDLVEVLVAGDPVAADQAMRMHIRYGVEDCVRNIQAGAPQKWRAPTVYTR
jgi:DNA-binding GntR family transcriptional regulator